MEGLRNLRGWLRFLGTPLERRRLVVYSEGASSWPHLGPVVRSLLARGDVALAYVSSSPADPGLALRHPQLEAHLIGDGHVRTMFFSSLEAGAVLMTMPDLESFHIKRSKRVGRYVYLHHSLVSSHMIYRDGAFDYFDAVLCAGPHHVAELRAIETLKGLAAKALVPHGYGRLDTLLAERGNDLRPAGPGVVLVAPSWGPEGLLERHAEPLMRALAASGWEAIVRPHPQTVKLAPAAIECVKRWCASADRLSLDAGVAGHASLQRAHVMVSDWSGAAFDFALGLERPVLFVDVPRKVNNPGYANVGIEPIEVFARERIGRVLAADALSDLPHALDALRRDEARFVDGIRAFRDEWVFHPGGSADVASCYLAQALG